MPLIVRHDTGGTAHLDLTAGVGLPRGGPLLLDQLQLLFEALRTGFHPGQLLAGEVIEPLKPGDAVVIFAVVFLFQADPNHTAAQAAAPGQKGRVQKVRVGLNARGGQGQLDGHEPTALQQIQNPHILAGLAFSVGAGAEDVVPAAGAQAAGAANAQLTVVRLALGRGVVIVLAPLGPVDVGVVAVEDDPLQGLHILRVVRVVAGHLEDQHPAAGDLDPLEAQIQAVHILRQLLLRETVASHHIRQQERGALRQSRVILVAHVEIPPIKIFCRAVRRPYC